MRQSKISGSFQNNLLIIQLFDKTFFWNERICLYFNYLILGDGTIKTRPGIEVWDAFTKFCTGISLFSLSKSVTTKSAFKYLFGNIYYLNVTFV